MKTISALDKLFPAPKDGNPGNDAVMYRIVCSDTTPNVTNGAAVITLAAVKITGSKREKATLTDKLHWLLDGKSNADNPLTLTIAKRSILTKSVELVEEGGTTPLDMVTISPFTDGDGIEIQYCKSQSDGSPDTSTISYKFVDGCEWMRTKMTTESDFSEWFRIVGEKGDAGPWTDYNFNLSSDLTSDGSTVEPGNLYLSTWQDQPLLPTTQYPYLWMKVQKYSDATTKDGNPRYVRLTGEQGPAGTSVLAQYSSNALNWHDLYLEYDKWMRTSKDGGQTWSSKIRIVGEKGDGGAWTDYTFNNSTAKTTYSPTTAPWPTGRSTWQDAPVATTDSWPYLWMKVQKYSDETTKDGEPTYVRLTGEQGEKGDKGDTGDKGDKGDTGDKGDKGDTGDKGDKGDTGDKGDKGDVGPMLYYAGEWQSGVSYVRSAQVVPLVSHGGDQFFYYPSKEGTLKDNEPSGSNSAWKQQQKVPLLLAQLLMVDFGKIASAVFSGDYMMSQYGLDGNNNESTDYKSFDGDPTPYIGNGFAPNICLDFLKGEAWLRKAHIFGDVDAGSVNVNYKNLTASDAIKNGNLDYTLVNDLCIIVDVGAAGSEMVIHLPYDAKYIGKHVYIMAGNNAPSTRSGAASITVKSGGAYLIGEGDTGMTGHFNGYANINFVGGVVHLMGLPITYNNEKHTRWGIMNRTTLTFSYNV